MSGDLLILPELARGGGPAELVEGPTAEPAVFHRRPSTTPLRVAVPLPVPGRS